MARPFSTNRRAMIRRLVEERRELEDKLESCKLSDECAEMSSESYLRQDMIRMIDRHLRIIRNGPVKLLEY